MKTLLIVESPTKARTLKGFLGKGFQVESSFGHVRDLPKSKLGIDTEKDFEPLYVIPTKARKIVNALKKKAKEAETVILAADEDREGEAIAWHLATILDLKNPRRIVFHEITKPAIEEALLRPREIDMDRVDAQQARRILDRLVGYKLSPFLWKKVARRLSAGRVQSAAVRLVAEREQEIRDFKPQEYWSIEATLEKEAKEFTAFLNKKGEKTIDKLEIKSKKEADEIEKDLKEADYRVEHVEKKEVKRNPFPPFTTSTLQQAASQRFRYPARMTMQIAQRLYETGLITYHRTDSLNLAGSSIAGAERYITSQYGDKYFFARTFKAKTRGAQEAHEAIRPTNPAKTPDGIKDARQKKLYELIQSRFLASQMSSARFDATTIDISARDGNYTFRANGQILKFDGFLKVYPMKFEEANLPELSENDALNCRELMCNQHFTQPPARYTEGSLIKALEAHGIGRPSTYAPILSTIQDRNYIEKNEQKRFQITEIGEAVNNLLVEHFPKIVDIDFTAQMEDDLDKIAQGEKQWIPMMKEFYNPFEKNLEAKYKEVSKQEIAHEKTDKKCPECSKPLIIRLGRYGKFYACSGFPECKYTESLEENMLNIDCPKCKKGKVMQKRTKSRKIFYGCNQYPECDFALWDKPTGERCEKCSSLLVEKGKQTKCSNPECSLQKKKK